MDRNDLVDKLADRMVQLASQKELQRLYYDDKYSILNDISNADLVVLAKEYGITVNGKLT